MRQGVVVWLDAPAALLMERLLADPTPRPLLEADDPSARLGELLGQRQPLYAQADLHVLQQDGSPEKVALQVLEALHSILRERTTPPEQPVHLVNEDGSPVTSFN